MERLKKRVSLVPKSTKAFNITESELGLLKKTHPRNVISIENPAIFLAECHYSYITNKGKENTDRRVFVLNYSPTIEDVQKELTLWQEDFNTRLPFRAVTNCTIIGTPFIAPVIDLKSIIILSEIEKREKTRILVNKVGSVNISVLTYECQYNFNNKLKTSTKLIPTFGFAAVDKTLQLEKTIIENQLNEGHKKVSNVKILGTSPVAFISL